ncbi:MAG: hypothetical protein H0X25_24040 [Acidobacteriales bacterium]|nr:hypothetical protein [Terriglobales bacterium]
MYRSAQAGGPYRKLSGLVDGNAYSDSTVASGETYYYVVTALGKDGVESGYSSEAATTIP